MSYVGVSDLEICTVVFVVLTRNKRNTAFVWGDPQKKTRRHVLLFIVGLWNPVPSSRAVAKSYLTHASSENFRQGCSIGRCPGHQHSVNSSEFQGNLAAAHA